VSSAAQTHGCFWALGEQGWTIAFRGKRGSVVARSADQAAGEPGRPAPLGTTYYPLAANTALTLNISSNHSVRRRPSVPS